RVGNLTLLEPSLNRQVGNDVYASKLSKYGTSGYALTRAVPDIAPEEWTQPLLEERQRQLAIRATRVWRADFH
ncbi:MAG: HNH endonuclease family protein, partial [Chloroflexota bacterium]